MTLPIATLAAYAVDVPAPDTLRLDGMSGLASATPIPIETRWQAALERDASTLGGARGIASASPGMVGESGARTFDASTLGETAFGQALALAHRAQTPASIDGASDDETPSIDLLGLQEWVSAYSITMNVASVLAKRATNTVDTLIRT
ncbi:hypothetical protein [Pararobbsia silviterrae]|uniref:Type III secretion protein n=1 Tax=Pararobbsia silviterrae TaxID=1792498 RepID=A0A494XKR9_9BURK|nr:hypothetical protein [Pararobbsia silviterrae]RKP50332.1 hypothetical protein D7S86_19705 [Pararobbsia silviterrae]